MNYVDPTLETPQTLAICVNADSGATIDWTLKKDGNDSTSFTFQSPSVNFNLTDQKYFDALTCDFFSAGIDLDEESFYILKGAVNGSTVYVGKIFVTAQDIDSYSVNSGEYQETSSPNNFVILD